MTIMVRIGNTASSRMKPERMPANLPVSPGSSAMRFLVRALIAKPPADADDGQ
jgi:hypothetical protein